MKVNTYVFKVDISVVPLQLNATFGKYSKRKI
jgi:hypothetical protein